MRTKVSKIPKYFNSSVLMALRGNSRSSLFNKFDSTYLKLSATEKSQSLTQLNTSLPSGPDILYRGTTGSKEVEEVLETDSWNMSSVQRRKASNHDIVDYIRENNSRFFLSTTPCPDTVTPYAAGLPLIPCTGFIFVTGLPKVYTRPQKILLLNKEIFEAYDKMKIEQQAQDAPTRYDPITAMTQGNNECTVILGAKPGDNWGYKVSQDVMKLIQVRGPGRILGAFMSSNEIVHVKDWINPVFRKRVWSMEVILSGGDPKDYDKMFRRAREYGLIGRDQRLLTLEDASAVADAEELDEINEKYKVDTTHQLVQVPREIAIGHKEALIEYMLPEIKNTATLEEIITEKSTPNL